jgi:hypothetical protein
LLELDDEFVLVEFWQDLAVTVPLPLELDRVEVGDIGTDIEFVLESLEGTGYRGE